MKEKLTKPELLAAIRIDRTLLEKTLTRFSETQKTEMLFENGWSIKDLMAHIASWERVGIDIVEAARDGETLKGYVSKIFENIDNFNAKIYEQNKDKCLSEIKIEFQAAHKNFITLINPLDDNFIASNLPFEGTQEISVQYIISANTHWHYLEHIEAIKKLADQ